MLKVLVILAGILVGATVFFVLIRSKESSASNKIDEFNKDDKDSKDSKLNRDDKLNKDSKLTVKKEEIKTSQDVRLTDKPSFARVNSSEPPILVGINEDSKSKSLNYKFTEEENREVNVEHTVASNHCTDTLRDEGNTASVLKIDIQADRSDVMNNKELSSFDVDQFDNCVPSDSQPIYCHSDDQVSIIGDTPSDSQITGNQVCDAPSDNQLSDALSDSQICDIPNNSQTVYTPSDDQITGNQVCDIPSNSQTVDALSESQISDNQMDNSQVGDNQTTHIPFSSIDNIQDMKELVGRVFDANDKLLDEENIDHDRREEVLTEIVDGYNQYKQEMLPDEKVQVKMNINNLMCRSTDKELNKIYTEEDMIKLTDKKVSKKLKRRSKKIDRQEVKNVNVRARISKFNIDSDKTTNRSSKNKIIQDCEVNTFSDSKDNTLSDNGKDNTLSNNSKDNTKNMSNTLSNNGKDNTDNLLSKKHRDTEEELISSEYHLSSTKDILEDIYNSQVFKKPHLYNEVYDEIKKAIDEDSILVKQQDCIYPDDELYEDIPNSEINTTEKDTDLLKSVNSSDLAESLNDMNSSSPTAINNSTELKDSTNEKLLKSNSRASVLSENDLVELNPVFSKKFNKSAIQEQCEIVDITSDSQQYAMTEDGSVSTPSLELSGTTYHVALLSNKSQEEVYGDLVERLNRHSTDQVDESTLVDQSSLTSKMVDEQELTIEVVDQSDLIGKVVNKDDLTSKVVDEQELTSNAVNKDDLTSKVVNKDDLTSKMVDKDKLDSKDEKVKQVDKDKLTSKVVNKDDLTSKVVDEQELTSKDEIVKQVDKDKLTSKVDSKEQLINEMNDKEELINKVPDQASDNTEIGEIVDNDELAIKMASKEDLLNEVVDQLDGEVLNKVSEKIDRVVDHVKTNEPPANAPVEQLTSTDNIGNEENITALEQEDNLLNENVTCKEEIDFFNPDGSIKDESTTATSSKEDEKPGEEEIDFFNPDGTIKDDIGQSVDENLHSLEDYSDVECKEPVSFTILTKDDRPIGEFVLEGNRKTGGRHVEIIDRSDNLIGRICPANVIISKKNTNTAKKDLPDNRKLRTAKSVDKVKESVRKEEVFEKLNTLVNEESPVDNILVNEELPLPDTLVKEELPILVKENLLTTDKQVKEDLLTFDKQVKEELPLPDTLVKKELPTLVKEDLLTTDRQVKEELPLADTPVKENLLTTDKQVKEELPTTDKQVSKEELPTTDKQVKEELPLADTPVKENLLTTDRQVKENLLTADRQVKEELPTTDKQVSKEPYKADKKIKESLNDRPIGKELHTPNKPSEVQESDSENSPINKRLLSETKLNYKKCINRSKEYLKKFEEEDLKSNVLDRCRSKLNRERPVESDKRVEVPDLNAVPNPKNFEKVLRGTNEYLKEMNDKYECNSYLRKLRHYISTYNIDGIDSKYRKQLQSNMDAVVFEISNALVMSGSYHFTLQRKIRSVLSTLKLLKE